MAAAQLGVPADRMVLRDKHVVAGDQRVAIAELARRSQLSGGGLIAHGTYINKPPPYDASRVENHPLPS